MHIQSKTVITSGVLAGSLVLFTGCGSHTADDAVIGGAAGAGAGALNGGPAGAGLGGALGAGPRAIIGSGQDKQDRQDGVEYEKPF